ncbi:MAG: U32 family peptidase, partial [Clostridia bacterium]|nr:U32 family peptidase [Clostridia bacterium]
DALKVRRETKEPKAAAIKNVPAEKTAITAIVSTAEQAAAAFLSGADEVALEPWDYSQEAFAGLAEYRKKAKLLISLPAVIISAAEREKIRRICSSGLVDGAIVANIGQLELIKDLPLKIAGSQTNAANAHTVKAYREMGFDRVTLSLELTRPQLRDISGTGTAVSIYGRTQLMQLRHCTLREQKGCQNCKGQVGIMKDEAGREFPLRNIRQAGSCLLRLLNCLPTDITDLDGELPRPEGIQLAFYDESPETVSERVAAAIAAREGKAVSAVPNATRGHWNRPVD